MGVQHIGINRLLHTRYHIISIKSVDVIANKEFGGGGPIGIAMLYLVGITAIFVSKIVERRCSLQHYLLNR